MAHVLDRTDIPLDDGPDRFTEETARVFGVPFEMVPFKVRESREVEYTEPNHIYSVPEKARFEITFPIVTGYQQRCHLNVLVADTRKWEQSAGFVLGSQPGVKRWVNDPHLGCVVGWWQLRAVRSYVASCETILFSSAILTTFISR